MFEYEQGRVTAVPDRSGNDPGRKWFRGSRMRNVAKFLSILFPRPHEQITKTASRFLFVFFFVRSCGEKSGWDSENSAKVTEVTKACSRLCGVETHKACPAW